MKKRVMFISMVVFIALTTKAMCVCTTGDITPPTQTTKLQVQHLGNNIYRAAWPTPTDNSGMTFAIKLAKTPISLLTWNAATAIVGNIFPENYGANQTMVFEAPVQATYCFSLKSTDDCGKVSLLSNSVCMNASATETLTLENVTLDESGVFSGTLFLNTARTVAGALVYLIHDPGVAFTSGEASVQPNAYQLSMTNLLAAETATNHLYQAVVDGPLINGAETNYLNRVVSKGKKAVIVAATDIEAKNGKIALTDLKFSLTDQAFVHVVLGKIYDANGVELTTFSKVLELTLTP